MKENKERFDRVLNTWDVISLAFGAAIGWSWVVLSGSWLETAGTVGAILAFVLGGIMVLFVGLTYAELTPALPECGGEHVFSKRALGWNWSFVCTWSLVLGYFGVTAFEACALPSVAQYLFPGMLKNYLYTIDGNDIYLTSVLVGSGCALLITFVNYIGVKFSSFVQGLMTGAILLTAVLLLTGAGFSGNIENAKPLFKNGAGGLVSVLVATPFLLTGFDVIPQAAEEINIPVKKIGNVIVVSITMSVVFYALIILGLSLIMTDAEISTATLVTADALTKAWGGNRIGGIIVIIGGMAGILSSWNAFLMGGSRCVYAMANSGMLPSFLARIHPRYKTPSNAVLLLGILSALAPFLGKSMLTWLTNAGSFGITFAYLLVAISFLRLRKTEPGLVRPYRVKNGRFVGVMAIITTSILLCLYLPGMSAAIGPPEWIIILTWSLLGALLFLFKSKERIRSLEEGKTNE